VGGLRALEPAFDHAWRARALAGEAAAVRRLTDAALGPLYAFCLYRVGRDRHLCEEVVQETVLRAVLDLESYEPARSGGNIFPWLSGLARNEVRRALARQRRECPGQGPASLETLWDRIDGELLEVYARLESDPFDDELLRRDETRQMVNATMGQLPPHYREALEAKYLHGRSVRDIAAAAGTTEKAIESLLSRAREAFRATFIALARNLGVEVIA
jgi:RNA polymerase sigma-70 factor, ECF subfamily